MTEAPTPWQRSLISLVPSVSYNRKRRHRRAPHQRVATNYFSPGVHKLSVICVRGLGYLESARHVNDGIAKYIVELLQSELESLFGIHIAILGITYNGYVGDTRESPGLKLAHKFQANISLSKEIANQRELVGVVLGDPYVSSGEEIISLQKIVTSVNAIVITTGCDEFSKLTPNHIGDQMVEETIVETKGILNDDARLEDGFRTLQI